jgi:subtilisin family serine protease
MRYDKIAPSLLTALDDFAQAGNTGLRRHARAMGVVATESQKPPRVAVFLRCDETSNLDHLTALGVKMNQRQGRVRTAFMPMASVDPVSDDPQIRQIIPSRRLKLLMDAASAAVHVSDLRLNGGLTGKQTLVGVVDSGIDPNHPAFQARILRIWDQTIDGPGVPEGDYGLELTGPALVASRDRDGHGTHVAGIAAGRDATFGGIAPDATLVIVKTDLQDAHIADGVRYVFRVAAEMNRPAVVNLSLGGHFDAHDGTDPLSQIIDQESGPGRIVCCAAGTEGNDNIHGEVNVKGRQTKSLSFHVPASALAEPILTGTFSGWYEGQIPSRSPSAALPGSRRHSKR